MTKRNAIIRQRTPVFFGCEGESEQGYGQLLNDLLRADNIPIHLEVVNLNPGAGDPIALLRKAEKEIMRRSSQRLPFVSKFILMDSDKVDGRQDRQQEAERLAGRLDLKVLWQVPCHEAFLLRHLNGHETKRPPTTPLAKNAIRTAWPNYSKPMNKVLLSRRLGIAEVRRAASVEGSLADFLRAIKLLS